MARTRHYSDFLNSVSGLIGLQVSDLTSQDTAILNGFFNKNIKQVWQQTNWMDVCPVGEYRVPNNLLLFGKYLGNSNWTQTNVTATSAALNNPVDLQQDASSVMETVANSTHSVSQAVTLAQTQYSFSVFAQAVGRNFIQLKLTDSASATYSAFFNLNPTNPNGVVVSQTANVQVATIQAISGLWFQCMITCTPAPGAATATVSLSTDGSTLSYAGSTSAGVDLWGCSLVPTQPSGVSQQLIPWEQVGENAIDVVYEVYNMTPLAASYPSRLAYKLTNNGIQLINSTNGLSAIYYVQNPQAATTTTDASPLSPAYVSYRKRVPDYMGNTWTSSTQATYGQIYYYTFQAGYSDFCQCLFPTTAGQSPDTNPGDWLPLTIPFAFFDYSVYGVFADWLRSEGQMARAQAMDGMAQDLMDREADRLERQMGSVQPWKVYTHLTSRPNPIR